LNNGKHTARQQRKMSSTDLLSNKQALDLIKGISLSPALQKSKDSILLAEDQ
jgi:hypothetical protein